MIVLSLVAALAWPAAAQAHNHHKLRHWFHNSGAACIHRYESRDWHANTGNGYFGGFQMGYWFMETYAPHRYAAKGTADHWTRWHQMNVVRRVTRSSGWGQWSTASLCGL